jgi:hypothetical protein
MNNNTKSKSKLLGGKASKKARRSDKQERKSKVAKVGNSTRKPFTPNYN